MTLGWTAISVRPVRAAVLKYDFEVFMPESSPLAGTGPYYGWFSFDDSNFFEEFTLNGVTKRRFEIQMLEFSFLGQTFYKEDDAGDTGDPDRVAPFPHVLLTYDNGNLILDGVMDGLSYRVDEDRGEFPYDGEIPDPVQDFTILGMGFGYREEDPNGGIDGPTYEDGKVMYMFKSKVPEPGMLLGLASIAIAGLSHQRWNKKV